MTQAKHTHWLCHDHGDKRHKEFVIVSADGNKVASVFAGFGAHFDWETSERHARLIAAAPELLAALDEMVRLVHQNNAIQRAGLGVSPEAWAQMYQTTKKARAALAKARGE